MTVVVIGRSGLSFSPWHEWLADAPGGVVLVTTPGRLADGGGSPADLEPLYTEIRLYDDLDAGEVDADLLAVSGRYDVTGVVALSEYDLVRAGGFRDHLGLPGQSRDSALAFRDKIHMRDLLAATTPGPAYGVLERALDLVAFVAEHGYPVVVKPRRGAGAVGVHVLRDEADLQELLGQSWAPRVEEVPDLMVETFVPGGLYHVDGLAVDGRARLSWPSRYTDDPSAFRSNTRLGSVLLDPSDPLVPRLRSLVSTVLATLPTPWLSSFHAEVFHTPDDELVLGEVASRTGGGRVNDTMRRAFGVNLNHEVARAQACLAGHLASPVDEADTLRRGGVAGWVVCYPPGPGRATTTPEPGAAPVGEDVRITPDARRSAATTSSVDGIASAVLAGPTSAEVAAAVDDFDQWFTGALGWEPEAPDTPDGHGVVILHRAELRAFPYERWLADHPGPLVLLASGEKLRAFGERLPDVGPPGPWVHAEAFDGYDTSHDVEVRAVELARAHGASHVVACAEFDVERAARLRDLLDSPGQQPSSARAFRDKVTMKSLAEEEVDVGEFTGVETAGELASFAEDHGYPLVVKPRNGSASVSTRIVDGPRDLERAVREELGAAGHRANLMAETFTDGVMYHVDGLVLGGRTVLLWPSRYASSTLGYMAGVGLASTMLDGRDPLTPRLRDFTERLLGTLPTPRDTTVHVEVFHTPDDELRLCEVASRTGGARVKETLQAAFGVDITQQWVRAQAGLRPDLPPGGLPTVPARLAGWALVAPRTGVVRTVPTLPADPWVAHASTTLRPGSRMGEASSSVDAAAAFVVTGDTGDDVGRRLEDCVRSFTDGLVVDTEEETPAPS